MTGRKSRGAPEDLKGIKQGAPRPVCPPSATLLQLLAPSGYPRVTEFHIITSPPSAREAHANPLRAGHPHPYAHPSMPTLPLSWFRRVRRNAGLVRETSAQRSALAFLLCVPRILSVGSFYAITCNRANAGAPCRLHNNILYPSPHHPSCRPRGLGTKSKTEARIRSQASLLRPVTFSASVIADFIPNFEAAAHASLPHVRVESTTSYTRIKD